MARPSCLFAAPSPYFRLLSLISCRSFSSLLLTPLLASSRLVSSGLVWSGLVSFLLFICSPTFSKCQAIHASRPSITFSVASRGMSRICSSSLLAFGTFRFSVLLQGSGFYFLFFLRGRFTPAATNASMHLGLSQSVAISIGLFPSCVCAQVRRALHFAVALCISVACYHYASIIRGPRVGLC